MLGSPEEGAALNGDGGAGGERGHKGPARQHPLHVAAGAQPAPRCGVEQLD